MMNNILLTGTLALCLSMSTPMLSQTLLPAKPETVGMSSERLKRVDQVLQEYVADSRIPGTVAFVARKGKIVYHKSFGYDDLDTKSPMKTDAIVRIASQTKAITSLAVLMLYEEGKFLLDDPVSRYIPTFASPKVIEKFNLEDTTYTTRDAKREITIRDLLTHSSGLGYANIGTPEAKALYAKYRIPVGVEASNQTTKEAIERLGTLPLFFDPGEKYEYGLNTDVLGYLVEVVSKQPFGQFLKEKIFTPLGMKDTYFKLPADKANRLAFIYSEDDQKKPIKVTKVPGAGVIGDNSTLQTFPLLPSNYEAGGAGLVSTAYDYAIFLQMLLNGGKYNNQQILSPTTVHMMTKNQIGHINGNFGLGFGTVSQRGAVRSPQSSATFDWGGAFGTTYWVDPVEELTVVLITQKIPSSWAGEFSGRFKSTLYQSIIESNQLWK